jgi:hypothetical protein
MSEHCPFVAANGARCGLRAGHQGMHVPVALPPGQHSAQKSKGCIGCALFALVGLLGLFWFVGSLANRETADTGSEHRSTPRSNPGWTHKAVASEREAGRLVGGWDDATKIQYRKGLLHIQNAHQKIGTFTIGEVIDQERSREQDRATLASLQREAAKARARAAEEARYQRGTPDCLIFDNNSLHTETGQYTWYIDGKVINKCDHDLRYVQVSFNFYDSAGNLENSGLVNVNNLAAGTTWAFHKPVYESTRTGGTFRVEKIEGF